MQCIREQKGFTLVELMIATVVLVVGLSGVAAMQLNAMNSTFFANSQSSGAGIALAWEEWLFRLIKNPDQDTDTYFGDIGMQHPENFVLLASLDADPNDKEYADKNKPSPFAQVVMPSTTQELVALFNGSKSFVTEDGRSLQLQFRKQGSSTAYLAFKPEDMPLPAPEGARMVWRIAANVPVENTATVEISIIYANAFVKNRGVTLRFVVGANMWGG